MILRDLQGRKVWAEFLPAISSGTKRTLIARIVNGWIDECATVGYDGVEGDQFVDVDYTDKPRSAYRYERLSSTGD